MQTVRLTFPELLFIAATRAMLGAGIAFLVSHNLRERDRKILGTALAITGAVSTIPAALTIFAALKRERTVIPDELPSA